MKRFKRILLALLLFSAVLGIWNWLDKKDYFQTNYNDLTAKEKELFTWQSGDSSKTLMKRYTEHFFKPELTFPRQNVAKVKLFTNTPVIGLFSGKQLKADKKESFLRFCNDTINFDWSETTWDLSESEYFFRLYDSSNNVVGKIYFCLEGCFMTSSKPFCPMMKFGGLSSNGAIAIKNLINDSENWE